MAKEGPLQLVPRPPDTLTPTLPPGMRKSISGKYLATDLGIIPDAGEIAKINLDVTQMWCEQFEEFNAIENPKTKENLVLNMHAFLHNSKEDVTDDMLQDHLRHLLSIVSRDLKSVHRRNLEKSADKNSVLPFFLEHFSEWQAVEPVDQAELLKQILDFIKGMDDLPPNEQIAGFIMRIHSIKKKKNIVKEKIATLKETELPEAARHAVQMYFDKMIDQNPGLNEAEIMSELGNIVFNIVQQRIHPAHSQRAASISSELRIVAGVLETREHILKVSETARSLRDTMPETPGSMATAEEKK